MFSTFNHAQIDLFLLARSSQVFSRGKSAGWAIEWQMLFLVTALMMAVTRQACHSKLAVQAEQVFMPWQTALLVS
jgi:hypothetical protein